MGKYFGTDGFRGEANVDLTVEHAFEVGRFIGWYFGKEHKCKVDVYKRQAIGIAEKANKVRQKPLRVILNGLGKDAAQIISRINGFTYVETEYNPYTNEVKEVFRKSYSEGLRAKVNCYGANSVPEGVAIMWKENVDVSITGNSTRCV